MATLLELVVSQSYFGQEVINRFNYVANGTPASVSYSFALVSAFGCVTPTTGTTLPFANPLEAMRNAQDESLQYVQATCFAIYDLDDFYQRPFTSAVQGLRTSSQGMSPAMAMGFRSNQVTRSVRRGYKRLCGIDELLIDEGGVLSASATTLADGIAVSLAEVLEYDDEGNTLTFSPAVVKKQEYTTPSGRKAYQYIPDDEPAQLAQTATGILWEAYDTIRTQNSRQYGRGR